MCSVFRTFLNCKQWQLKGASFRLMRFHGSMTTRDLTLETRVTISWIFYFLSCCIPAATTTVYRIFTEIKTSRDFCGLPCDMKPNMIITTSIGYQTTQSFSRRVKRAVRSHAFDLKPALTIGRFARVSACMWFLWKILRSINLRMIIILKGNCGWSD